MDVFVDSDVIISSLLSQTGASYQLLHRNTLKPIISTLSKEEIEKFITKNVMDTKAFHSLLEYTVHMISLRDKGEVIKDIYGQYVFDENDAHIVAGAREAHARFIVTYNIKDFNKDKIKQELDILVLKPGMFLQYLRSL